MRGFSLSRVGLRKDIRLLVVDDQCEQYDQLCEFADMYSPDFRMECKHASSEDEARALSSSWRPSVVLVDLHLLNSETLALLKQLSEFGAPVVATSVERLPDIEQTAQEHGAVGYVMKSTDIDELETLVSFVASVSGAIEPTH